MTTYRAIRVEQTGGPEVLRLAELEPAPLGPGQARVRIAAAGVNFIDIYHRDGSYPRKLPFTAGLEGAGTVVEVADGVTEVTVGDRVAWENLPGSYAAELVGEAAKLIPVPDDVSDLDAAAFPLQGLTVQYLTTSSYALRAGDDVLVHAGAGGVGQLLIQVASRLGARVVATASTPEKRQLCTDAGAADVIGYEGFDEVARDLTGGQGVHAVYDGVGKDTFDRSMNALRIRGSMVLFGAASGQPAPVDPRRLAAKSLFLTRPKLADHVLTRDELLMRAADVLGRIATGELALRIGGRYDLADAARAHEDLAGRRTTGKLLLIP
ncbi:quinone oxidoreductase family protein [Nakamurella deserti]|uniref:quinone oxidoreductase family protein n=1 Tax=Nakamurella deserti TaxID=2164074 RepID=UPI000DBE9679|nr:quinone oxidoreductase [Nakamurella deserti]